MNWKYTSGSLLPNGVTVAASADDVKPSNATYVAIWGNDSTGNGSRLRPYRNIGVALGNVIIGTGFYNEVNLVSRTLIADGDVTIDGTGLTSYFTTQSTCYNITFQNNIYGFIGNRQDASTAIGCVFRNIQSFVTGTNGSATFRDCLMDNVQSGVNLNWTDPYLINCTFVNCANELRILGQSNGRILNNVFYNCQQLTLALSAGVEASYSLFFNCKLRPATTGTFNTYATIADMRTAFAKEFAGCKIADPLFNSVARQDYTLQPTSPARNLAFNGKYVGTRGVGFALYPENAEYLENITITSGLAALTDNTLKGVIRWPVTDLGAEYEGAAPYINGVAAYRNGESFNPESDLAATTIAAGANLTTGQSYVVETGTINYNSQMYNIGTRFTAVAAATTFITSDGGVVRQILKRPTRAILKLKTHRFNYDQATFDTLSWQLYEAGQKITANRVGDVGTGAIIRGNGASDFDRTPAKVLPVFFRGIQAEVTIMPKGLRAI